MAGCLQFYLVQCTWYINIAFYKCIMCLISNDVSAVTSENISTSTRVSVSVTDTVMSCHVMSCHVMSCHVMSCHVMSCHVMSCHVLGCVDRTSPAGKAEAEGHLEGG